MSGAGRRRAAVAVALAVLLAVAPVAGVVEVPAARATGGNGPRVVGGGVATETAPAVAPVPLGTDATAATSTASVAVSHSNEYTIYRTDGQFSRTTAVSVSGVGDALDDRYSFRIENVDTGASVDVAIEANESLSLGPEGVVDFRIYDGTGSRFSLGNEVQNAAGTDSAAVNVTGANDTFSASEHATYVVTVYRDGQALGSTDPAGLVTGYAPAYRQNSTTGAVRVSVARDGLPRGAVVRARFATADGYGNESVSLEYDADSGRFVGTVPPEMVPEVDAFGLLLEGTDPETGRVLVAALEEFSYDGTGGSTLVVDDDGDAGYRTVGDALANASDGDRIEVRNGTYDAFRVGKNVTVTTDGAVIEGTSTDTGAGIRIDGAATPMIEGFTVRTFDMGIQADVTTGAWTVRNVTVRNVRTHALAVVDAKGAWTVADSRLADGNVAADLSDGDWRIVDTYVGSDGVWAFDSTGDWTIRRSVVEGDVSAYNTSGRWTIDGSVLTGTVNARKAYPPGDATGNYWGQAGGPREGQCAGNVTCDGALSSAPAGAGPAGSGDDDGNESDGTDGPLSLAVENATVAPGGQTRLNVTVENVAGRTLSDVGLEPAGYAGSGLGVDGVRARIGGTPFAGRGWEVDELPAGERVEVSFLVGASPERFLEDGLGPRTLSVRTTVGGEIVADLPATVGIVEPGPVPDLDLDVSFGQAGGTVDPGGTLPVYLRVTNRDEDATGATVAVTNTPFDGDADGVSASTGSWDRGALEWTIPTLDPGATATASVELSVPDAWNLEGYFGLGVDLRIDGRRADDAYVEAQVPGEDGSNERPTAAVSVNRTVQGNTVYAAPGDTLRFDASTSLDPDGTIRAYRWDFDGDGETDATGPTATRTFAESGEQRVTLTVDDGGLTGTEELVVDVDTADDRGDNETEGGEPDASNLPPVAVAAVSPSTVTPGESVSLSADPSRDRDDASLTYEWDTDGDGSVEASGRQVTTAYDATGNRSVTLTVTDPHGASDAVTRTVAVRDASALPDAAVAIRLHDPAPSLPGGGTGNVTVGDTVVFDAGASDSSPAGEEIERYEWTFVDGVTATGSSTRRAFDAPGEYEVTLTVEDDAGRAASVSRTVTVRPPEREPEVVAVEPLVPGRLLQGLGLENTYFAGVVSEEPIDAVRFDVPGVGTVAGRSVTGRLPFVNGSVYAVDVPVDDLEDGGLRVTAVDEDGDAHSRLAPVEVVDAPPYLKPLFPDAQLEGNRLTGYVVTGGESRVPRDLVGPSITFDDVRFVGGTYGIGVRATLDAEYRPGANRVTVGGNASPELVATSPWGDATLYSGGAGVDASGEFSVRRDRVAFSRVGLTLPPRQTTLASFPVAGVYVNLPTVKIPIDGRVDPGRIGVGIEVSLSVGAGGTVEVVSTGPSDSTPYLPDGAALGVVVTPQFGVTITAGAGGSVTVYGFTFGVALEGFGGGTVGLPLRVVDRGELSPGFTGRVEGGYDIGVRACIALCAETVLVSGRPTFDLGGGGPQGQRLGPVDPADADAPGAGETRIVPKRGGVPAPGVGDDDVGAAPLAATDADGDAAARLTRDALADRPASVALGGETATAVWAGQTPGKDQEVGFDLYAAERTNGTWSGETRVTDDRWLDLRPSVATAGDDRLVAWSRLTPKAVTAGLGGFETVVAARSADGWTDPVRVTNDSALALNAQVAGYDGPEGERWLVTWLEDADANLTTGDRSIRYAVLDGTLRPVADGSVPGGVAADVAAGPDGFTLGVLRAGETRAETSVVRARLGPNGTVADGSAFGAANVTTIAAAPGRVAWAGGRGDDARLRVAGGGIVRDVPLGNVTRVAALSATAGRGATTLTYRATGYGPAGTGTRPVYQVRTADGWTRPRTLDLPANLSARTLDADDDGRELLAVASAEGGRETRTDVVAVSHRYRPDLVANATATVAGDGGVGAATTVRVAVANDGERASGPTVVAVRNATGTVATRRVGSLSPGQHTVANVTLPLDYTGRVRVVADPGDGVDETDETNNADAVVAVRPDPAVLGAVDRREDGRLELDVRLRNDAPVPVGDVPIRVTAGNRTRNVTLRGLGAGRNWTRTVTLDAAVGASAPLDVVVDPADRVPEADESNNRYLGRVLRPDLGVLDGAVVREDPQGARAAFVVRNTDTGPATANVSVRTPAGERTYRVAVPPARGPRDVVTVPVSLAVPNVTAGGNLTVTVASRTQDVSLSDNAARTRVRAVRPAANASAPLVVEDATGRLADGSAAFSVTLRNPANRTVGEVATVRRDGAVVAREPVATAPGTRTVTLRTNASGGGTYALALRDATATVELSAAPGRDPDGDGRNEDVTGDGRLNVLDVAVLLERFEDPAFQDAAARFDFTGDGRLNVLDVAELLAET